MQKEDELLRKEDARLAEIDARLAAILSSSESCSNPNALHARQVRSVIALLAEITGPD
jgi:hypothetical protein